MRRVNYLSFTNDKTNIPYVGPINHELVQGLEIEINLLILPYARRFAINLQCGPNTSPRDDVALHFSPDFDRMTVIRNNILQNSWGPEETVGAFPFIKGQHSRICICYNNDYYKIKVDDHDLTTFLHRIPPSRVNYLAIDGDITLNNIEIRLSTASPSLYGNPSAPIVAAAPYPTGIGFTPSHSYSNPPYSQSQPPYPVGGQLPYPSGQTPLYSAGPAPYPNAYPPGGVGYSSGQPQYNTSGRQSPYLPGAPGYPSSPHTGYHNSQPYPQQPGMYGGNYAGSQPYVAQNKSSGPLDKAGAAIMGTLAGGGIMAGLKHGKNKISKKKALKYGLPIAGVGLGAYALHKGLRRGSHSSSSSSSSSSD